MGNKRSMPGKSKPKSSPKPSAKFSPKSSPKPSTKSSPKSSPKLNSRFGSNRYGGGNAYIDTGEGFLICGRNPVKEAIIRGREIQSIYIQSLQSGINSGLDEIAKAASEKGIKVKYVSKEALDEASEGTLHQGVIAIAPPYEYADLDEVLRKIDNGEFEEEGRMPLLILLDGIEDPHNLGAIIRTAECAGAAGVVIPKRHSARVNETVAKTSAGAVEYLPCIQVTNIANTIDKLKEYGFWIYACDMDGENLWRTNFDGRVALVIGNEGSGVSRLVKEKCDFVVSLPMRGSIDSLNASNAAALVIYEVLRQSGKNF